MVSSALRAAVADLDGPLAVLDLAALKKNAAAMVDRASGLPIRLASKSVRVPEVLRTVLDMDGYEGILAYSLPEALALAEDGFSDLVVAYPTTHVAAIKELAASPHIDTITLMIDSIEHLDFLSAITDAPLRLAIDIDASLILRGLFVGTRRSPVRSADDALELARAIPAPYRLVGLMCYEGQIAGVGNKGNGPKARIMRALQSASIKDLLDRRTEIVTALSAEYDLEFVNGGGTGSLESSAAEGSLTEVAAGSGLYSPTLFDGYDHFRHDPALYFASPVVRRPGPDWVTVFQGGWIASGAIGKDRLPSIAWPDGLRLSPLEGAGEVQTPLTGDAAKNLAIGEKVFFRHAKAGEGLEHMTDIVVVDDGAIVDRWATYRGLGWRF